jgi:aarF domain-containing kinase
MSKIAQIVSSRPDFVPPQYVDLFTSAQDSIPQWPIEEVVEIVEKTLDSEFGLKFDDVFETMDPVALGSASIGQVHRAVLKPPFSQEYSGGDVVAVKIMHPKNEERFHHDFQVFRWLCKVALKGWEPILDECYRQIMTEFDYRREAESLSTVRQHMTQSPYHGRIRIPEPLSTLSTKELLIMEMLNGKKLSDALEDELASALGGDRDHASALIKRKRLGKSWPSQLYD